MSKNNDTQMKSENKIIIAVSAKMTKMYSSGIQPAKFQLWFKHV